MRKLYVAWFKDHKGMLLTTHAPGIDELNMRR